MITNIDSDAVRAWLPLLSAALDRHQDEINALNVFPIPDGDTGTNMALTVRAGVEAVKAAPQDESSGPSVGALAGQFSAGALAGARGNSGVILAAYLGALLGGLSTAGSAADLGRSLAVAADAAYASVGEPIEGTILSVAAGAAAAASELTGADPRLDEVVLAAVRGAIAELDQTPIHLPALARAGVVDAGGRGLVVVLESLGELVTGERIDQVPTVLATPVIDACVQFDASFEVMYSLDAPADRIPGLRDELARIGTSIVVAGAEPLWSVHVHTDDVGAAIEVGVTVGRPHGIQVNDLRVNSVAGSLQSHSARASSRAVGAPRERSGRRLVAVAHGPGMGQVLESAGVCVVTAHGRVSPSAAEFEMAADGSGADEVVLLPSSSGIRGAAEVAAAKLREQGVTVAVIPTRSIVQTLAAVAVHDPAVLFADDVVSMTRAATATHYGGVSISTRDAMTTAGRCAVGDVLGIVEGDVVEIGSEITSVAAALLARMLSVGGELVTIVEGEGAPADFSDRVLSGLRREHPGIEIISYSGGQPLWPLIIGVE